ncbi:HRDC domain-containing protein [Corynebacterium sp. HS2168-gen11]|uniref:HRDC domain-containing protein n=1 Tax=Corynebacterium sp. HS2168-gen11 TaxID=2974027 RepID=UPI00216AFE2A|nr:HRDC domain-containing protein [Corynebacterium sp. HS2168-gen11]MCS4535217.1 HRDC domain-containing protein [Corynebacterium sp. HS2168-gen11]
MTPLSTASDSSHTVYANASEIQDACNHLREGTGAFALDTERASGFYYDERAFLIQICRDNAGTFLIDPRFDPPAARRELQALLNDQDWILHAGYSDQYALKHLKLQPAHIFDTELASRLLGHPRVNLAAMVEHYLGVTLKKGHGSEDWSTRPLPQAWLRYAALDVEYLLPLQDALLADLDAHDKRHWAEQEFEHMVHSFATYQYVPKTWLHLKGLSNLRHPMQLAVANALWSRRDEIARAEHRAVHRLLPDKTLVALAQALPRSYKQITAIRGIRIPNRKYLPVWLKIIRTVTTQSPQCWPNVNETLRRRRQLSNAPSKHCLEHEYPAAYELFQRFVAELDMLATQLSTPRENLCAASICRILAKHFIQQPPHSIEEISQVLTAQHLRPWQCALLVPLLETLVLH